MSRTRVLTGEASLVILAGVLVYLFYDSKINGLVISFGNIKEGFWLLLYVLTMVLLSYFRPLNSNMLTELGNHFLVLSAATIFYFIGVNRGKMTNKLKNYLSSLSNKDLIK